MYNYKAIQNFIDTVNNEAEQEAQKVYDKYEERLLEMVRNQIKPGDVVWVAMGTASIDNPITQRADIGENLCMVLGQMQFWKNNISAGFSLPHNFTKTEILKQ